MTALAAFALGILCSGAKAAFVDLGAGARAPGLGNAFTALADDVHAVHYNPAGLGLLERPQLAMSHAQLHMGLSDGSNLGLSQFAYAHPVRHGRWGTLGGAWERFSLDDVYDEQALFLSWGRKVLSRGDGAGLLAGLNAKYVTRSFKQLPEAFNAYDQATATGLRDPVLTGDTSKSAVDADFGLLYRTKRRLQFGLMAQHVNRPDVGFAGTERLPMNTRLGLGYKSLWMNLSGELRMEPAPSGSMDKDLILAAERFFPTLDHGQFAARGSLGVGSRSWKQITFGLSYRINKVQLDYAFLMPIGSIAGTIGSHRMGMTFHFGAPTAEDEISKEALAQAQRLRQGRGSQYGYESLDAMRPHDLSDPLLEPVRRQVEEGRFADARTMLAELAKTMPPDESLIRLSNRLDLVASYYRELASPREPWEVVLSTGLKDFLGGRDHASLLRTGFSLSLTPDNTKLNNLVSKLEEVLDSKALRLPPGHPRSFTQELLFRAEAAYNRGDPRGALGLLDDVLAVSPEDATALALTGSLHYTQGRYLQALHAWERALPLQTSEEERRSLTEHIRTTRERLSQSALPAAIEKSAPTPKSAAPAGSLTTEEVTRVERLYERGLRHFAKGENLQATAMFMRILQIDPGNVQAKKALERLERRR